MILSYHYDIKGKSNNKELWYIIVLIVLIILSGLRYRVGTDTPNYIYRFYHEYPSLDTFSFADYPIGRDPFYAVLNSIVKSFGGRFYYFQIIQACFVILLIFRYIKRHCQFVFTCALIYFVMCYVQFNFEIMRASMSIAVSLYANDYALDKKWIKAYALYFIAGLFHVQAFALFLVPFFLFLRFNQKGIYILFLAFIGGLVIQKAFGSLIEMISVVEAVQSKGANYVENALYNDAGGNINFYIVYIFPSLAYTILALRYLHKHTPHNNLLTLEPFAMLGLIFLLIQMNVQIISRYVDCFEVYMVMFIAEYAVKLTRSSRREIRLATLNCILLFFPFVFLTLYQYKLNFQRIIPYNSVLARKIDRTRELVIENPLIPPADMNEY